MLMYFLHPREENFSSFIFIFILQYSTLRKGLGESILHPHGEAFLTFPFLSAGEQNTVRVSTSTITQLESRLFPLSDGFEETKAVLGQVRTLTFVRASVQEVFEYRTHIIHKKGQTGPYVFQVLAFWRKLLLKPPLEGSSGPKKNVDNSSRQIDST